MDFVFIASNIPDFSINKKEIIFITTQLLIKTGKFSYEFTNFTFFV